MAPEPPNDSEGVDYPRRRVIALLLGVAVVAVVVFGIVLLFGGEDEPETKRDKILQRDAAAGEKRDSAAERTVIRFVAALNTEDQKTASKLVAQGLEPQLGPECPSDPSEFEVEIVDVRVSGPKAAADIEIRDGDSSCESSLELLEGDEGWRITQFGD